MNDTERARLRWRCRRGLLELDLLLQRFVEHAYSALNDDDRRTFDRLLTLADADLLALLQGEGTTADPELTRLVDAIRRHAYPRV